MYDWHAVGKRVIVNCESSSTDLHGLIDNTSLPGASHVDSITTHVGLSEIEFVIFQENVWMSLVGVFDII